MEGLARRFWQGNETHRGVPGAPGRVATLVEEREAVTHGMAMELKGEEALDYLNNRYQATFPQLQKQTAKYIPHIFIVLHPTFSANMYHDVGKLMN